MQLSEQRYGTPVIESTLVSNVPAATQLLELFQGSSRKEVKSLVAPEQHPRRIVRTVYRRTSRFRAEGKLEKHID